LLEQNYLQLFLDFIMFDAEATLQDLAANIWFLEQHGLDSYVPWDHLVSHMTPYLGTAIRDHYQTILKLQFQYDQLPDPDSLFVDPTVKSIFLAMRRYSQCFSRLTEAVKRLEEHRGPCWDPKVARSVLNAITLRRMPFVVLRNLVGQASKGLEINLERAVPLLIAESGRECSLEELIENALQ
jgi:hypothetical protein